MTEKRYGLEMDKNCYKCIVDTVDGKIYTDKKQVVDLLNELNDENQRLTKKLNQTALELVGVISQGKAVEISEMSYHEFLDYRAKNGKPMELQL